MMSFINKEMIYAMNEAIDENLCIPSEMIPHCPKCGSPLTVDIADNNSFFPDVPVSAENAGIPEFCPEIPWQKSGDT